MLFNNQGISYDITREGEETVLRVDYEKSLEVPSLEDSEICMADTIEKLMSNRGVTKILFSQKRDYEYDYTQTRLLVEIAKVYAHLLKQKAILNFNALTSTIQDPVVAKEAAGKYSELQNLLYNKLKKDPIGAYVELKRVIRREKIEIDKSLNEQYSSMLDRYVQILNYVIKLLEETRMIQVSKAYISGMEVGDRTIYRRIFTPNIKPEFIVHNAP